MKKIYKTLSIFIVLFLLSTNLAFAVDDFTVSTKSSTTTSITLSIKNNGRAGTNPSDGSYYSIISFSASVVNTSTNIKEQSNVNGPRLTGGQTGDIKISNLKSNIKYDITVKGNQDGRDAEKIISVTTKTVATTSKTTTPPTETVKTEKQIAEEAVEKAKIAVATAQIALDKATDARKTATTQVEKDKVEAAITLAQAALDKAQADLKIAEDRLDVANGTKTQTEDKAEGTGSQSNTTPGDKEVYNLLAPIGSLKSVANTDVGTYLGIIFRIIIALCGVLAVVMIVIGGIQYMGDESVFGKTEAKERIFSAILGLLIALGAFILLNTINPALTGKDGLSVGQVIGEVRARADDVQFMKNLDSFNTSGITINTASYADRTFLGYLAHQQGVAGASAILWSSKKGYKEVPSNNPFTKSDINRNMKSNFNVRSAQKTIGTSTLTPDTFLKYWATKVAAVKSSVQGNKYKISQNVLDALTKVINETSFDTLTLKTMCIIESSCNLSTQATTGTYVGLFAISKDVFKTYGKGGDILDPYSNTFAAVKLFGSSFASLSKNMPKISGN